ncbi:hypothetical protein B0H13DRAFT_1912842 [Mycena leptocephala]|nr:hypothetical protein B0H13DRAFT_1912842 [Mycena leptocephala]
MTMTMTMNYLKGLLRSPKNPRPRFTQEQWVINLLLWCSWNLERRLGSFPCYAAHKDPSTGGLKCTCRPTPDPELEDSGGRRMPPHYPWWARIGESCQVEEERCENDRAQPQWRTESDTGRGSEERMKRRRGSTGFASTTGESNPATQQEEDVGTDKQEGEGGYEVPRAIMIRMRRMWAGKE